MGGIGGELVECLLCGGIQTGVIVLRQTVGLIDNEHAVHIGAAVLLLHVADSHRDGEVAGLHLALSLM